MTDNEPLNPFDGIELLKVHARPIDLTAKREPCIARFGGRPIALIDEDGRLQPLPADFGD